jgi:hypothetical protein
MSKINRPSQKVTVFDPETGGLTEAATTDASEMQRRANKAVKDLKAKVKHDMEEPITEIAKDKAKRKGK